MQSIIIKTKLQSKRKLRVTLEGMQKCIWLSRVGESVILDYIKEIYMNYIGNTVICRKVLSSKRSFIINLPAVP